MGSVWVCLHNSGKKTQCPLIIIIIRIQFENCRFRLCSESSVPILFDIPFNTYLLDYGHAPKWKFPPVNISQLAHLQVIKPYQATWHNKFSHNNKQKDEQILSPRATPHFFHPHPPSFSGPPRSYHDLLWRYGSTNIPSPQAAEGCCPSQTLGQGAQVRAVEPDFRWESLGKWHDFPLIILNNHQLLRESHYIVLHFWDDPPH